MIDAYENISKEQLIEENINLKSRLSKLDLLEAELAQLKRMIFGSKSERFIPASLPGQLSLLDVEQKTEAQKQSLAVAAHERKKNESKKPSRNLLPEHLERVVTTIYPQGFDENTGQRIGEEVTEVLNYIPGKLVVEQTIRVRIKTEAGKIVIADLPSRPIAKGLFGNLLIARILIDKYVDHLPLYRQCERFNREGVTIASSTVGDVPRQVAELLQLLYEELKRQVIASGYLNADETPTPVLDPKKKGKTHRGYHWVYYSPHEKLVLFDYRTGRGREGPEELLENFKGFLQTDGYSVYDGFGSNGAITLVGCMAHARRYFEQALLSDRERAQHVMQLIQKLYATERKIPARPAGGRDAESTMSDESIIALRHAESKPVLDEIKVWLDDHLNVVTPTSPLGKAISYMYSRWNKLTVYINHAQLNIDNNLVENAIRPTVIGRKNYMFSGSHEGAERSAMFYSFFGSCKMNGINPEEWLVDVLQKISETKSSQLYSLLPSHWKKA